MYLILNEVEEKPDYGNKRIEVKFTAERQRLGENREIETEKKEEEELNKSDQGKESVLNNPVNPREAPSEVPPVTPLEIPDPQPPNEIPEISPVEVPEVNPIEIPEKEGDEQGSGLRF